MALSINEDDEMLEDIMENGNQDDDNDDIPEEETSFIPIPKSSGRPPRLKRQVTFLKLASDAHMFTKDLCRKDLFGMLNSFESQQFQ